MRGIIQTEVTAELIGGRAENTTRQLPLLPLMTLEAELGAGETYIGGGSGPYAETLIAASNRVRTIE